MPKKKLSNTQLELVNNLLNTVGVGEAPSSDFSGTTPLDEVPWAAVAVQMKAKYVEYEASMDAVPAALKAIGDVLSEIAENVETQYAYTFAGLAYLLESKAAMMPGIQFGGNVIGFFNGLVHLTYLYENEDTYREGPCTFGEFCYAVGYCMSHNILSACWSFESPYAEGTWVSSITWGTLVGEIRAMFTQMGKFFGARYPVVPRTAGPVPDDYDPPFSWPGGN